MKIVLCTGPHGKTDFRWPALGLLYIATYIESKSNHEVKVIDAFSSGMNEKQFLSLLKKEKPDVLGLSCTSYTFLKSMKILENIKKLLPHTVLVLGGIHGTFFAEKILKNYKFVDFVVRGEGEFSFFELVNNLNDKTKLKKIKGLAFRYKNKIVNSEPGFIPDLDVLPFPDRNFVKDIDYAHYWSGIKISLGKFTTIVTSRGCPFNCTFCCCCNLFNRKWRKRSVENVLDELEEIYSQGYETCIIIDDNFTLVPERVIKVCRGLVKRKIKLNLHCEGRVNTTSLRLLKEMKKGGVSTIYFGMESGLQKVLNYYKKNITVEQIRNAVRNSKKVGINAIGSFIIGSEIENKEDVLKTIEFATDLRIFLNVNPLDIVPGSELWFRLEKDKKLGKDDWKGVSPSYKYFKNFAHKELLELNNYAYKLNLDKLIKQESFRDFISMFNSYNRKIIFQNIFENPSKLIRNLIQVRKKGYYRTEQV